MLLCDCACEKIFEFELLGEIWCLGGDMLWFSILVYCKKIV